MSNDYDAAWDVLGGAIGRAQGHSSGSIDDIAHLSVDQQLKVVEISALLSIAQELSSLNPQNTTYFADGQKKNGWGLPAGG